MPHPLVDQLRFARSEFLRAIDGVSDDDGRRRFGAMNCLAWNVAHMAWQEQRYWLTFAQDKTVRPDVQELYANGAPAQTPALSEALQVWREITAAADPWLDEVAAPLLAEPVVIRGRARPGVTWGNLLLRTTYHYWYHCGENAAIRQQLGHTGLPEFVGDIDGEAPYRPA